MKTIIVPIDLSEASKRRGEFAIDMAKKFHSKIIFSYAYNVIYAPATVAHMSTISSPGMPDTITQHKLMERKHKDFVENLRGIASINYEKLASIGATQDVVNGLIDQKNDTLAIIGPSDETSIETLLLGNPDEKMSRTISCSVLFLPNTPQSIIFNKVSLALDTRWFENEIQLDALFTILRGYNATLDIVHVLEDKENVLKKKQLLGKYEKSLNDLNYSFHIVHDNDIKDGIISFLKKQNANLLAILYQGHSFFERLLDSGIRKKMISEIDIPLLILK